MGVLDMKPFWLYTYTKGMGYIDEDGNKHVGEDTYTKYIRCDVIPSGAANTRDFGDGIMQSYSYTIYVYDRGCKHLSVGEKVRYGKDNFLSKPYLVKGFHRYQTYCILWI